MKRTFAIAAVLLVGIAPGWAQPSVAASAPAPASCAPFMGLNFVCGMIRPEDLLQIGSSKWVIASGMGEGGGISIIVGLSSCSQHS